MLNNEFSPNNKVFRISSYHSVIRQTCQRKREHQGDVAHGDTKRSRVQLGKHHTWPPHVQIHLNFVPW